MGQLDLGAQSGGNSGKSRGTHTDLDIQNKHIICIIIGNIIGTIKNHIVQMFFIAICLNQTFQGADDQPDFAEKVMNNFYFNNSFVNTGAVNDIETSFDLNQNQIKIYYLNIANTLHFLHNN